MRTRSSRAPTDGRPAPAPASLRRSRPAPTTAGRPVDAGQRAAGQRGHAADDRGEHAEDDGGDRGGRRPGCPTGPTGPPARQRRAEGAPAGGEDLVVRVPSSRCRAPTEHPREDGLLLGGRPAPGSVFVMRVPSLSSSSITPSMAAWMSQATLCSGRTSSRSTMPPCAGEMPDGGANSIVVICSSSVASTPAPRVAPAGGDTVAHVAGSAIGGGGAGQRGAARRSRCPGTGGGGGTARLGLRSATARSRRAAVRRTRRRPRRPSTRARVRRAARATWRGRRPGRWRRRPRPQARAGSDASSTGGRPLGGAGRGGCRVERGALHALDRDALVGVELVDGGHDVAGLDLADVARRRRSGGSRGADGELELERGRRGGSRRRRWTRPSRCPPPPSRRSSPGARRAGRSPSSYRCRPLTVRFGVADPDLGSGRRTSRRCAARCGR